MSIPPILKLLFKIFDSLVAKNKSPYFNFHVLITNIINLFCFHILLGVHISCLKHPCSYPLFTILKYWHNCVSFLIFYTLSNIFELLQALLPRIFRKLKFLSWLMFAFLPWPKKIMSFYFVYPVSSSFSEILL